MNPAVARPRVTVSRSIQTNHDRSKKYWHNCIRESNGICRWSPAPWDTIGTFLTPRILSTMSRTVTSSAGQTHFARKWCKGNDSALHRSPVSYRNMPTFRLAGRFLLGACIGVPLINRDGALFGTLGAIDPNPHPVKIVVSLREIQLWNRMLTTITES